MENYCPSGPLYLKNGGYRGIIKKSLEQLMFSDYKTVYDLKKWAEDKLPENNPFRRNINWLFEKGRNIRPIRCCGIDGCLNCLKFFSVRFSDDLTSISRMFMCCDNEECISKLRSPGKCYLYEIKFDVHIINFSKVDLKKIGDLLAYACGIKIDNLSANFAFEFFKSCTSTKIISKFQSRDYQLSIDF